MFDTETVDKIFSLCSSAKEIVQKAIELALDRHSGQLRIGGELYINHILRVGVAATEYASKKMPEQLGVLVPTAILHDILEDTPTTYEELREKFGQEVAMIVRALSHEQEEESDEVYLTQVVHGGKLAVLIKRFDCLDNIACLAEAPENFRTQKIAERKAALPIWERIDPEGARQIEEAISEVVEKIIIKNNFQSLIGADEKVSSTPQEIGLLFGRPVLWVWWRSVAGGYVSDREGGSDWEPDRKGTFVFFRGKRYDNISYKAAELCIQWHYPLEYGNQLQAELDAKPAAPDRGWVERMKDPQTDQEIQERIKFDSWISQALFRLRATSEIGSKRAGKTVPLALPTTVNSRSGWQAENYTLFNGYGNARSAQEVYPIVVEGANGASDPKGLECPICQTPVLKNQPCENCLERLDDRQDRQFREDFKSWWPDPINGLEEYRKIVNKNFRLFQHQCACGKWAKEPVCQQCQEELNRKQALDRLQAATHSWVGRKIEAIVYDGCEEIAAVNGKMVGIEAIKNNEDDDYHYYEVALKLTNSRIYLGRFGEWGADVERKEGMIVVSSKFLVKIRLEEEN